MTSVIKAALAHRHHQLPLHRLAKDLSAPRFPFQLAAKDSHIRVR